jgi:serine/threonine protein kinase
MSAQALPTGHAVHEYRVDALLGVGGFGLTYLATDVNLNLRVALKEYLPGDIALRLHDHTILPSSAEHGTTFEWGKRRFLDESRTLASFRHPNIVRVMRFFEANGTAYMVMEYVDGAALPDWLKPRRPLPHAHLTELVGPLLDGLQIVHTAGYLHRDIKPGNIYIRHDDSPVLLDFGSARQQNKDATAIVTPGYAPFEQYHTEGKQGPWSDIYAFAGVLYWIITGNRPLEAAARVRQDSMPPALQAGDRVRYRGEFLAAVDWGLAPHEDDRPKSVREWREALLGSAPAPTTRKAAAPPKEKQGFEPKFLKDLEGELAQHIGPIATVMVRNAAKKAEDPSHLIEMLAADITHDGVRLKFEKRFADDSRPVSRPPQPRSEPQPSTSKVASRFSLEALDRAEQRLAPFLGPLARVVVKRTAMKARDESELYLLLADEIENPADRKAFVRRSLSTNK